MGRAFWQYASELVFIGQDLDKNDITRRLTDCLITEDEVLQGSREWAT